ncbi:MAG: DegT/DnrJ/EryC1/StrS family aminotransferase [Flavobacteriales bacterium]
MIPVTKTFLPPIDAYQTIVRRAWDNAWITNRGELIKELEDKLKTHLGVPHLTITTNGTLPLQIAIKALGLTGEIITTPFSYVATTASIVWEACTPVFVDIHPEYLTIDESLIEAAITPNTSAILATHVFGNPCHIEAIEAIAQKHQLKVIYDAAHCFGVNYKGTSIFNYGDVSTCSFHATKIFHTGEGGAMFSPNAELHHKLYYHHNFGHNGPLDFYGLGINAKTSELQAAMGLAVFPYIEEIFAARQSITDLYQTQLQHPDIQQMLLREHTQWNYSYFPVIFRDEKICLKIEAALKACNIVPRRYFYPSLNSLPYVTYRPMPVAEKVAASILCLPLYHGLNEKDVQQIIEIILKNV